MGRSTPNRSSRLQKGVISGAALSASPDCQCSLSSWPTWRSGAKRGTSPPSRSRLVGRMQYRRVRISATDGKAPAGSRQKAPQADVFLSPHPWLQEPCPRQRGVSRLQGGVAVMWARSAKRPSPQVRAPVDPCAEDAGPPIGPDMRRSSRASPHWYVTRTCRPNVVNMGRVAIIFSGGERGST